MLALRMLNREAIGHAVKLIDRTRRREDAVDALPFEIRVALRREREKGSRGERPNHFVKIKRDLFQPASLPVKT